MDSSILTSVATGGAVATAVIVAVKAVFETRNLRSRNIKELLDLIEVAENRFKKELANKWRYRDAEPPKGSFEDSLFKDQLVSHIFGRSITWSEYRKIREFLMDHENIPLSLLRYAWPYRDSKQASRVCFRMTWRIGVSAFFYSIVCMGLTLVTLFGAFLVWLSFLVPPALALEFSLIPQLQQFLLFLGVQHGEQLRPLGLWIIPSPLAILILTVVFYYDGYAAFRICRKTESHAKQNKSCTPR